MDLPHWVVLTLAIIASTLVVREKARDVLVVWCFMVGSALTGFVVRCRRNISRPSGVKVDVLEVNDSLIELHRPSGIPRVQVLFFHGLPFAKSSRVHLSTWECGDGSSNLWPQTWLVEEFPGAHVFVVRYSEGLSKDSRRTFDMKIIGENLLSDLMQGKIGQVKGCPVVLVGHSVGGLVIKQLCWEAHETLSLRSGSRNGRVQLENFLNRIRGIFYYATPHHGIPHIDKAADLLDSPLFKYFHTLSTEGERLNNNFRFLCTQNSEWQIKGLAENRSVQSGVFRDIVVVPEASAREGELNVETADHFSISKPPSKTSRRFNAVTGLLHNAIDSAKEDPCPRNLQYVPEQIQGIDTPLQDVKEMLRTVTSFYLRMRGTNKSQKQNKPETASTGFNGEAQSIHQLAAEGNMPSLRGFLRINPHMINSLNEHGQTAMHVAASCGNLDLAKYLRRGGAKLNADDNNGQTPLHCASIQLREPLVRFLLSEGADKRVEDDKGKTALDYAKDDFIISWMLRFGHSLEDRNPEKNDTALGFAAWAGNAEAVGRLLEQGANVEARNGHQYTALMGACQNGRIEVVKLLLKHGADKEARVGDEGWTPLLLGVVHRQIEVVQLMIAAGANMETKSKHIGHTALCEALWQRHWEIARLLLNSGADIHARDCFLYTPLNRAAMDGYVDDVKLILDKGADINAQNRHGWSALTEACYLGYPEIVALLLSRGTAIDSQDHGLATPLYLAAKTGHTAIVSQLLAAGANPSTQEIEGWTPLEVAAWNGFDEIASLLLSAGADPNIPDKSGYTPLCKAAWAQRVAVARVLLEKGAYIEAGNKDDWTSLTEAAFYGGVEMIELLLDHGANIEAPSQKFDSKDEGNFTPLMRAAERHLAATECLLRRGANVEAKSSIHGWTPLLLAVCNRQEEIVRRLIEGGADIWAGNKTGRTPVMEAARVGGIGMVKMMNEEFAKANAKDGWEMA